MQSNRRQSTLLRNVSLKEMINCLEDLINYFAYPADDLGKYNNGIIFSIKTRTICFNRISSYMK